MGVGGKNSNSRDRNRKGSEGFNSRSKGGGKGQGGGGGGEVKTTKASSSFISLFSDFSGLMHRRMGLLQALNARPSSSTLDLVMGLVDMVPTQAVGGGSGGLGSKGLVKLAQKQVSGFFLYGKGISARNSGSQPKKIVYIVWTIPGLTS